MTSRSRVSRTRLKVAALAISFGLLATACGVPDDVATEDDEITLETLTPVAPADDVAEADDAVELDEDQPSATSTSNASQTDTTTSEATPSPDDAENDAEDEAGEDDEAPSDDAETDDAESSDAADEVGTTTDAPSSTESVTTTAAPAETSAPTTAEPVTTVAASNRALPDIDLELELVASLSSPVGFAARPGTSDIFIAEQGGRIVRLPNGAAAGAATTLDLRGSVSLGNEQGLLGLAFAPDGNRLYTNHTNASGSTIITRYSMNGNSASSPEVLLTIPQPFGNHNGGQLAFGPDGLLYIGMGDGGSSGDPQGNGQNPNSLHGSILRIDVSGASGYSIPSSNPFANGGGAPEVYIWGIRNAWRFGFDSATGDLWIGDVGQDRMEEVTVLRQGSAAGANLGWNLVEGTESFRGLDAPAGHVGPVITYAHGSGRCSITGGEVYRGSQIAGLGGTYLYGDFCTGEVFGFRANGQGTPQRLALPAVDRPSSFGLDNSGQIYVLSRGGGVFRIVET